MCNLFAHAVKSKQNFPFPMNWAYASLQLSIFCLQILSVTSCSFLTQGATVFIISLPRNMQYEIYALCFLLNITAPRPSSTPICVTILIANHRGNSPANMKRRYCNLQSPQNLQSQNWQVQYHLSANRQQNLLSLQT